MSYTIRSEAAKSDEERSTAYRQASHAVTGLIVCDYGEVSERWQREMTELIDCGEEMRGHYSTAMVFHQPEAFITAGPPSPKENGVVRTYIARMITPVVCSICVQ